MRHSSRAGNMTDIHPPPAKFLCGDTDSLERHHHPLPPSESLSFCSVCLNVSSSPRVDGWMDGIRACQNPSTVSIPSDKLLGDEEDVTEISQFHQYCVTARDFLSACPTSLQLDLIQRSITREERTTRG